jgi:hypothetical protein
LANRPVDRFRLFDVNADPREMTDLSASNPDVAQRLQAQLQKIIDDGRSR